MPIETEKYPSWVGLIYVFNLIVGTGALTLPSSFASAGVLLSTILLTVLCFVSFICVTFVIESIACINALVPCQHQIKETDDNDSSDSASEETAIINNGRHFNLDTRIQLCEMFDFFFNKIIRFFLYAVLSIYLFGDLSIYTAAVAKTLVDLSCDTLNDTSFDTENCWSSSDLYKIHVYRIYVLIFAIVVGPFTYCNVQKTKYLQIITLIMRWTAFLIMVFLAVSKIVRDGPQGHPSASNFSGVPILIGSSIYSFMCHHSIPNLIVPFSNKEGIFSKLGLDMILISVFYMLLSITGVFAFSNIQDLYTLNFIPEDINSSNMFMNIIYYFLGAFPLFTLSTSFPIIAITLQNNLKNVILSRRSMRRYNFFVRRLLFPSIAILPPIFIALATHELKMLVEVTGSYPGVFVQYICPVVVVFSARKACYKKFGYYENKFHSPFKHYFWYIFVILWACLCIGFETYNFIVKYTLLNLD